MGNLTEIIVHGFEDVEGLEPYISHHTTCVPDAYVLCGGPGSPDTICSHRNGKLGMGFLCTRSANHPGPHVGAATSGEVQVWPNEDIPHPFAGCAPLVIPKEAFND